MRATSFVLPLAFAFAANAINLSIGPDTVCGANSVDCNNGFCCSQGNTCDTSGTITKCGSDGTLALPYGVSNLASAIESQVKSANSAALSAAQSAFSDIPYSSWVGDLESIATAFPTSALAALSSIVANGNIPTDASALSSFMDLVPSAARPAASSALSEMESILGVAATGSGTSQPQSTNAQGGASFVGASTFGNTAAMVAMIWGAAAIGGAMLVL